MGTLILNVDLAADVPIYQQIRDQIVEAIAHGALKDGSSLPPTRTLAADFGINFHTANKAYDLLRQEGLIRLSRGTGAVVTAPAANPLPADWTGRVRTLLAEAVARGASAPEVLEACRTVLDSFSSKQQEGTP